MIAFPMTAYRTPTLRDRWAHLAVMTLLASGAFGAAASVVAMIYAWFH
jgi:hypothetical protein